MSLIYSLFGLLDYAVYSIASVLIRVIVALAGEPIFSPGQIESIVDKVYIVVGVLMLFKLVISAIQYMVNPDTFDDKDKGLIGILKKTAISLGLIVLMPAIFDFAIEMQQPIIESLPKIILSDGANVDNKASDTGEKVSFEVLRSFIGSKNSDGSSKQLEDNDKIHSIETFREHIADGCPTLFLGNCHYNYMILISTICGGFLVYVLLSLTLDVAIRTIKFAIIRILAPIPISSYIYNKDKLSKFTKTAVQVYTDLFIRMAIIYFIIFAIEAVFKSELLVNTDPNRDFFMNLVVKVALIFGLLMFAKQAPKFISELLGLPDIGAGDMADMFKPAWQRAGGAAVPIGMAKAAAGNAVNNWLGNRGESFGKRLRKAVGSGVAGATSAGFHGGLSAIQGKNTKEVNAAGYKRAIKARQNRDLDRMQGIKGIGGVWQRAKVAMADSMGLDTNVSLAENKIKAADAIKNDESALKGQYVKLFEKYGNHINMNTGKALNKGYFRNLESKYGNELRNTGDPTLINLANRMANDGAISYADLIDLRNYIAQKPDASTEMKALGRELSDSDETMKQIQKSYMMESMAGRATKTDGTSFDLLNVKYNKSKGEIDDITKLDIDLASQLQSSLQDITSNEVPLSNEITNSSGEKVKGSKNLRDTFMEDFGSFATQARQTGNRSRQELAANKEAAAREANKRRAENNKKNN